MLKTAAKEPAPVKTKPSAQKPHPDFEEWRSKNGWYDSDEEMRGYADTLYQDNHGLPYSRILKLIDGKVRENFPEKFEKKEEPVPKKKEEEKKAAVAEGGTKKSSEKSKFNRSDLSEGRRRVMDQFIAMGVITEEKYIEDLVDMGELS